jgi:hypothetical protein
MPNWCGNKLEIYSLKKEKLKDFIEKAKSQEWETDLSFNNLYPCPKELLNIGPRFTGEPDEKEAELIEKYGFGSGYFWCVGNWGTKFDVRAKIVTLCDHTVIYEFDTAWAPPVSLIRNILKIFPDFIFILKYNCESGVRGIYIAHGEDEMGGYVEYGD